jgi:RNA polymerase sigma-70 factor, ECF subfamily
MRCGPTRGSAPARAERVSISRVASTRIDVQASIGVGGGDTLVDETQVRVFFEESYPRLVAVIALVEGSQAGAEDAVMEALARAWDRADRGERIDNLAAWVTRVAMNLSRSKLRRLRVEARTSERQRGVSARSVDRPEERVDVERALAALPRRQRQATVLRYYLGMDVAEIAEVLGVSEGSAKTTLFRARRHLAAALGENDEEDAHEPAR